MHDHSLARQPYFADFPASIGYIDVVLSEGCDKTEVNQI